MPPIVLLTDFGPSDTYVGQVKGSALSIFPKAQIVDLLHEIKPYAIESAAYLLAYSYTTFPKGSVFVCVVDPGVGTKRRALVMQADGRYFVAPDNGLVSVVKARVGKVVCRELTSRAFWRKEVSSTFHGRDIFGPVGAHLARRASVFAKLGPRLTGMRDIPDPIPLVKDRRIDGRTIHVDRFGNVLTNIESRRIPEHAVVRWRNRTLLKIQSTYGNAAKGDLVAVKSSFGLLELAMRERSLADAARVEIGERITVKWK